MFLGQFQHSLDEKGRLMIPARYRELLAAGAFVTQGFDKCLMVMTDLYFGQVYDRINAMNLADPTARLLRRLILSNAYPIEVDKVGRILVPPNPIEVDKVGRILVPPNLRHAIELDGEAIVAGQGEYFEVWNPSEWNAQINQLQDVETNNQRFATLDLSRGFS
jgi:MraZ protein